MIAELLTINTAQSLARQAGYTIPRRTINYACANGFIAGARKAGRDWIFTHEAFFAWVNNRPKPGRKQT